MPFKRKYITPKRLSKTQIERIDKTLIELKRTASSIRTSTKKFQQEVKKNTGTAIAGGFAFLIALFWRDAVIDSIDYILKEANITTNTYMYKIIAAIIVTLIAVLAIMHFSKWSEEPPKP